MAHAATGNDKTVRAAQHDQKARHGGPEPGRDPAEQNGEQGQSGDFELGRSLVRKDFGHEPGGDSGLAQHQYQQHETPYIAQVLPLTVRIRRIDDVFARRRRHGGRPGFSPGLIHAPLDPVPAPANERDRPSLEGIKWCPRMRHHRRALQRWCEWS
ncbi:hypothetical protein ASE07_07840 [Noviherbaspirillum sp. Root189]|nr:hypothetical protein ASE07_07840 [Noviherbaspirillum sp. Root189]